MTQPVEVSAHDAARLVGVTPGASWRVWARRRGLRPVRQVRVGRATTNLFDADEVFEAQRVRPDYTKEKKQ